MPWTQSESHPPQLCLQGSFYGETWGSESSEDSEYSEFSEDSEYSECSEFSENSDDSESNDSSENSERFENIPSNLRIFAETNQVMNQKTLDFIRRNADGDVRQLAFRKEEGVDMPFALDQIAGRQTARRKLPAWAAVDGIVYPPHLSMEQCSSEATARYKAELAQRLTQGMKRKTMADLTGGFGVDFSFMSQGFDEATYVERQPGLCELAAHNFNLLGLKNVKVVNTDGTDYIEQIGHVSLLYVDPARRDTKGARTYAISDCTPDVAALRDQLMAKADRLMVKLSPMLDWRKAVADMGGGVNEVHIVSVNGECKELLLVIGDETEDSCKIYCVDGEEQFVVNGSESVPVEIWNGELPVPCYLYEPNASIMKAGCFGEVCRVFGFSQLARDSHLFVSKERVDGFPGRSFRVDAVTTMNKKELRKALAGVTKANISVRNFPLSVDALRKRLKISEGGGIYLFATTLAEGSHVLLVCSK